MNIEIRINKEELRNVINTRGLPNVIAISRKNRDVFREEFKSWFDEITSKDIINSGYYGRAFGASVVDGKFLVPIQKIDDGSMILQYR